MLSFHPITQLRIQSRRLYKTLRGPVWFPHVPVTLLVFSAAAWLIYATIGADWASLYTQFLDGRITIAPRLLAPIIIGAGLLIVSVGLLSHSRVAWIMALILIVTAVIDGYITGQAWPPALFAYLVLVAMVLAVSAGAFRHANLAASSLFSISSIFMLFSYATYGSYHFGADYDPPIEDLFTAFYYSLVTMSTVGYGEITPRTSEARIFTISLIVFGVAVFATSLTAIATPLLRRSVERITNQKEKQMKRENHIVVLGNSALAQNTYRELLTRGQPVTRVLRDAPASDPAGDDDIVIGDAGNAETLQVAGCDKAIAILAMFEEDAENAFAILAVRDLGGKGRTVCAVNDPANLSRIRLVQPDVVIAPQILGGELAAMLVCGEEVTADFVLGRVLHGSGTKA